MLVPAGQFGKACPSTFTYNGDGLRVARGGGWLNSKYVWDVASGLPVILKETDSHQAASSLGTDNTYVYGLGLISVTDRTGAQTYFTSDGLGSTTDLTDGTGTKTDGYTYDVFGAPTHTSGASANNFQFTGQQRDANSGLDYLRARYYDPSSGRFLSRDTAPVPLSRPSAGNRYAYVGNNPTSWVDPSGLWCPYNPEDCIPEPVKKIVQKAVDPVAKFLTDPDTLIAIGQAVGGGAIAVGCLAGGPADPICWAGVGLYVAVSYWDWTRADSTCARIWSAVTSVAGGIQGGPNSSNLIKGLTIAIAAGSAAGDAIVCDPQTAYATSPIRPGKE